MGERIENSIGLVQNLAKIENDYFFNSACRNEMRLVIKQIDFDFEKMVSKYSREKDAKSMISLFLLLERLKKHLVFENFILNLIESELNALISNFDLSMSDLCENENNKSDSSNNVKPEIIQTILSAKKQEPCMLVQQKMKNKRANYPKKISRVLKNWLKENMNNPYPSESEKSMLMELTGLDSTQINNWFINARRRILPYMKSKYIKYE